MNKRILISLVAILAFAGSDALASRARVLVMGTGDGGLVLGGNGDRGSFYYEDGYNLLHNPADINQYNNWGIIEKSNGAGQAEGGFVTSLASINVGLFFNRATSLENGAFGSAAMRPLDLIFGMESGDIQWGVGISYARDGGGANNAFTARGGLNFMDFGLFGHHMLKGKSTTAGGSDIESTLIGIDYTYGEWKIFTAYRRDAFELGGVDTAFTKTYGIGISRNSKIAEGVMLNYAIGWWGQNTIASGTRNQFPLEISVEGDAADWVTLRAGFTYMTTSSARLGATFRLGELDFDWAFGNNTTSAGEAIRTANFDLTAGFFTAASVTYKW